ncbi:MAG: zinc ribbon domain-containing protein [Dehalococcoidia bacterium]|nr:zinc ribbon domain-containing protein [Dehalococcoidia bacterium]
MSVERRYRPDDGCPLFSERLEEHIVAYTRGELPNRGRFCGHCYTPLGPDSVACPHCATAVGARAPVEQIPEPVVAMLRAQRGTERTIVNSFAYLGLIIAIVGGLAVVLGVPYLRAHLLPATIVYALILLVGGRVLAGVVGGYYGDRLGYERARQRLLAQWAAWLTERG